MFSPRARVAAAAVAAAAVALVSACSSSPSSATSAAPAASGTSPASGTGVKAPSDTAIESVINNYAPIGFTTPSGTLAGLDPQLGAALGKVMNISLTIKPDSFENSITGLESGRVQLVPGASITKARLQTMDFVPYYRDSYRLAVLPSHADIGSTVSSMCGMNLGLVTGDATIPVIQGISKNSCGSKPIRISTFPDGATIETAVKSGRVAAWACALSACGYQSEQSPGTWKITGPSFASTTIGIASKKGSGWAQALVPAVKELIDNGTYMKILKQYGIQGGALTASDIMVNPVQDATS